MSFVGSNILAGASGSQGGAGYQIERSLRFNSADSAYLNRTPSSASNRRTFTFSTWVKRHKLGTDQKIFGANSNWFTFYFSSDTLRVYYENAGSQYFVTNAVFRDVSAWYHLVLKVDTTQSNASDRVKFYANGEELTFSSTGTTSQNYEFGVNTTNVHDIGMRSSESNLKADFSLADVHFIDGQALDPTDFGEYDDNNVWQPKEFAGTYGTNGFHLDFSDNSSNAALGDDSSGNNNDWTVNNISVIEGNGSYIANTTVSTAKTVQIGNMFDGTNSFQELGGFTQNVLYTATINTTNLTGTGSLIVHTGFGVSSGSLNVFEYNITHNGGTTTGWTSYSVPSGSISDVNIGTYTDVTQINLRCGSTTSSGNGGQYVAGFTFNGTRLIDNAYSAGNDSLIDTPTNYEASSGNNGGNYATLNPLTATDQYALITNGNLDFNVTTGTTWSSAMSTMAFKSEKIYFEYGVTTTSPNSGVSGAGAFVAVRKLDNQASWAISGADNYTLRLGDTGYLRNGTGSNTLVTSANPEVGDIFGFAIDGTNGTYAIYENGTQISSGSLSLSGYTAGDTLIPWVGKYPNIGNVTYGCFSNFNFGQRPFVYPPGSSGGPSSDYKSLCTTSLTDPTIADGSTAMDITTFNNSAQTSGSFTTTITPDLIITKRRDTTSNWVWQDIVRGYGDNKNLHSNLTVAETSTGNITGVSGTTVSYGTNSNMYNSQVAWYWDGGTSTVSNTDGSITSSVRANPSAGFSIVTYTGTGSNATVGHGLGATPDFIIVKNRSSAVDWVCNHKDLSSRTQHYLLLNSTAAQTSTSGYWNTGFNSTTFGVGNAYGGVNASGNNYIAYCFAPVEGYSAFGKWTGGSDAFVYLGFRPKFLLIKANTSGYDWLLFDSERSTFNLVDDWLSPNLSAAETQNNTVNNLDFLSNGFKIKGTGGYLGASVDMLYAAFAEHPFKTARAR